MENLAGRLDCDLRITEELKRCRIPKESVSPKGGEVPYNIIGRLGKFTFVRAWYYWMVEGPVPLYVAWILYADPVGVTDIRVAGHCGCPSPEEYGATWRNKEGKIILKMKEKIQAQQYLLDDSMFMQDIGKKILVEYDFAEDPSKVGIGFVESYHIDTEVGLRVFVDTLRIFNLV